MPIVEINGAMRAVAHAYGATRACRFCGAAFVVRSITGCQYYCSDRCKERAQWRRESRRPEVVAANRERCRRWASENRAVRRREPWLLGPPAFGEYLPGGAFSLRITPAPQWAIELRNTRALHGLVTTLLGEPHDPNLPGFALIPSSIAASGWGVYIPDEAAALRLAGRQCAGVLFDREVLVTCGPMHRIKAPRVISRGHRHLRIDFITPVIVRSDGGRVVRTSPTAGNLCSTLSAWLPRRIGLEIGDDDVRMHLVERHTQVQLVRMGGKYGCARGFVGHMIVDTNAVGEWLLRCAETIGLGGKCAFGFGRIRVSNV